VYYSMQLRRNGAIYRLLHAKNGDHFYTTSQTEANNAIYTFGYQSEGIRVTCSIWPRRVTTALYRLLQVAFGNVNATQSHVGRPPLQVQG